MLIPKKTMKNFWDNLGNAQYWLKEKTEKIKNKNIIL